VTTWYTVAEVASMLRISQEEVRHQIRSRQLGHMKVNPEARRPTYRISAAHLAAFEKLRERKAW
jgi:excisionase family DNA binding protein